MLLVLTLFCAVRPGSAQDITTPTQDEAAQKAAWEKCKAALEAQGEHLEMEYFIPPPVPDDKNFALTPLMKPLLDGSYDPNEGFKPADPNPPVKTISAKVPGTQAAFPVMKGWMTGNPRPLEAWQVYYRQSLPDLHLAQSPAEDVLTVLDRYDGLFDQLRRDLDSHPLCRYPVRWDLMVATALPHLSALQGMVTVLGLRTSAELELNRPDKALADLQLAFRLMNTIHDEPTLIDGLVRITTMSVVVQPIWEGFAAHRWNDAQLAALEKELRGWDFLSDFKRSIRLERCVANWLCEKIRDDPKWLGTSLGGVIGFDASKLPDLNSPEFKACMYKNQILIDTMEQEKFLAIMDDKAQTVNVARALDAKASVENLAASPSTFMAKIMMPVYTSVAMKFAQEQTYVNEAIVACEIERYRIARGRLPASLDDLKAKDLPHDVINGQPLHYKPDGADNYLLYSVGWNGTDDGGKIVMRPNSSLPDFNQGDWVWTLKPQ